MAEKKVIRFITLGCAKNLVDSEKLASYFPASKFEVQFGSGTNYADFLLLNTCGFIQEAKEESIQAILEAVELKKRNKAGEVVVWGCLSQRYGKELEKEIPEVDFWEGTEPFKSLADHISGKRYAHCSAGRVISTPSHYAYLKISEGCNRLCSFCAIPLIRGKYRSFPVNSLVNETRMLACKGVKELILIAQDLSYYGIDINGKQQITKLVQSLSSVEGIEWIRLHYLYPHKFPEDLLYEIRENPKVCKYIDIPFQHINNRILKSMRRGNTTEETHTLISRIRKIIPGAAIRTTLMTGYPGENEEEFNELCDFVEKYRFDRLGIFSYSHEDSTSAGTTYRDSVPRPVKTERTNTLMEIQRNISLEKNEKLIGKTCRVIIDGRFGRYYSGRTQSDSPEVDNSVLVNARYLSPGEFYDVVITGADDYDVYAKLS